MPRKRALLGMEAEGDPDLYCIVAIAGIVCGVSLSLINPIRISSCEIRLESCCSHLGDAGERCTTAGIDRHRLIYCDVSMYEGAR